ncbi:MAG: AMP-binding protein [Flavobacteriales bacterium]
MISSGNIYAFFIDTCRKHASRIAIHINGKHHSYSEFSSLISSIKTQIPDKKGRQFIGVFTDEHVNTYASIWSILSLGEAYVPINKKHPVERSVEIIESAGLNTILYAEESGSLELLKKALDGKVEFICTTNRKVPPDYSFNEVSDSDYVYLLFTSGSSGKPKGVPITHKNLMALAKAHLFNPKYAINEEDKFLQMFELTFDFSVLPTLFPFCIGASVYVVPQKGILFMEVLKTLQQHKITKAYLVPSVINYLEPYLHEIALPNLQWTLFCGEALYENAALKWAKSTPQGKIINTYGPTEATVFMTEYFVDINAIESHNGIVSIGKAVEEMQTSIIDGELYISGDQCASQYWKDEERSIKSFVVINGIPNYRTGDLCKANEQDNLMYCGRSDQQVKINGYRIELEEIEFHAKKYIASSLAAFILKNNTIGLVIQGQEKEGLDSLKQHLPSYMIPEKIFFMENLPLNENGKVDRKKLAQLFSDDLTVQQS